MRTSDHFTSFVEAEEISEIPTDETIVATVLTPIEETHEYLQNETVSVIKPAEETTSRRRFAHLFAKKNSTDTEVENTEPAHVEEPKKKTGRKSSFSKILERANIDGGAEEPANQNIVEPRPKKTKSSRVKKSESKKAFREIEPEPDLFSSQGELELYGQPKGRFEGEAPNIYEGEDLDIPTFLRDMD